jgi:hypothetical protein
VRRRRFAEVGGITINAAESSGSHRWSTSKGRPFVELSRGDGLSYVLIPIEYATEVARQLAAVGQERPGLRPFHLEGIESGSVQMALHGDRVVLRRRWEERLEIPLHAATEVAIVIADIVREHTLRGTALLVRVEHVDEHGRKAASMTTLPIACEGCRKGWPKRPDGKHDAPSGWPRPCTLLATLPIERDGIARLERLAQEAERFALPPPRLLASIAIEHDPED